MRLCASTEAMHVAELCRSAPAVVGLDRPDGLQVGLIVIMRLLAVDPPRKLRSICCDISRAAQLPRPLRLPPPHTLSFCSYFCSYPSLLHPVLHPNHTKPRKGALQDLHIPATKLLSVTARHLIRLSLDRYAGTVLLPRLQVQELLQYMVL